MKEKKVTKIRLSTAILCLIIFILIVALIIVYYFGFIKKDESNYQKDNSTVNEIENYKSDDITNNKKSKNTLGENISIDNDEIQSIIKKFNFGNHAESIYKVGNFNSSNIPNDLILKLGWLKVKQEDRKINDEILYETVSRDNVEKSIKNIFGEKIKYEDKSFRFGNTNDFNVLATENVYYNEKEKEYSAAIFQGGAGFIPLICENVQKAIKNDDKIEIYVKTAFVNPEDFEMSAPDCTYCIYNNYNFNREEFENKVYSVPASEFEKDYDFSIQLSTKTNKTMTQILDKLNTYVYTFSKDKENGEYYFSGFFKE